MIQCYTVGKSLGVLVMWCGVMRVQLARVRVALYGISSHGTGVDISGMPGVGACQPICV